MKPTYIRAIDGEFEYGTINDADAFAPLGVAESFELARSAFPFHGLPIPAVAKRLLPSDFSTHLKG